MATKTITLPNGIKVKSASQRRFILVAAENGEIIKRSDRRETLVTEVQRIMNRRGRGVLSDFVIADTLTGELRSGGDRII